MIRWRFSSLKARQVVFDGQPEIIGDVLAAQRQIERMFDFRAPLHFQRQEKRSDALHGALVAEHGDVPFGSGETPAQHRQPLLADIGIALRQLGDAQARTAQSDDLAHRFGGRGVFLGKLDAEGLVGEEEIDDLAAAVGEMRDRRTAPSITL